MNPLTNMKNVLKLSEQELRSNMKTSWHDQYKSSAWIFVGGLPYDLTEGDIICVFSQYGEVVNLNLVRDKGTGKSKGFCFICYEDQRSTNLAVDNFNGIKLLNRTIRVDHCEDYKAPKDDKMDEESRQLHAEGCAPGSKFGELPQLPSSSSGGLDKGLDLPPMESLLKIKTDKEDSPKKHKNKKEKKEEKTKNEVKKIFKKKKKESSSSSSSDDSSSDSDDSRSKKKKSQKKLKRKQESSTSSSDESENGNNKRSEKISDMSSSKSNNAKQSYERKSHKHRSSESESENENKTSRKKELNEGKEFSRHKDDHKRSYQSESGNLSKPDFSDRRVKDEMHRPYGGYRDDGKDKSFSHRSYRDNEKGRGDFTHGLSDRSRDDSRRYGTDRNSRDDRNKKYSGDSHREDGNRHDNERKKRGDRRENEYYRKKDSGNTY